MKTSVSQQFVVVRSLAPHGRTNINQLTTPNTQLTHATHSIVAFVVIAIAIVRCGGWLVGWLVGWLTHFPSCVLVRLWWRALRCKVEGREAILARVQVDHDRVKRAPVVAVVGGGPTGVASAYAIKQRFPEKPVHLFFSRSQVGILVGALCSRVHERPTATTLNATCSRVHWCW